MAVYDQEKFIEWLRSRRLTETSLKNYNFYYEKFGGYEGVTQEYLDSYIKAYNYNSVAMAFCKNYFEFLGKIGVRQKFPGLDIEAIRSLELPDSKGRPERKIPEVISENDLWQLESVMATERDKLMLLLSFYCGVRLDELINIKPFDFQWRDWEYNREKMGKLKVTGKGGGEGKQRIILTPSFLMERIEKYISEVAVRKNDDPEASIWGISHSRWQKIIWNRSKLGIGKRIHPHILRHSCATWLMEKGWDIRKIAELLGHESVSTTQIYTHVSLKNLEESYPAIFSDLENNSQQNFQTNSQSKPDQMN